MRTFVHFALSIGVASAFLAGCNAQRTAGLPSASSAARLATHPAQSSSEYSVIYSFKGGVTDGAYPAAGLTDVNGTLYGTTRSGGFKHCYAHTQCGTVFTITPSGTEAVLYAFRGGAYKDGEWPLSGLTYINGTFYGTTERGGYHNHAGVGTAYSLTPSGSETVLHQFSRATDDGTFPEAGVTDFNGTLYGTTRYGGLNDRGTVFSIGASGAETVVYNFGGDSGRGANPVASLIRVKGLLYGTTLNGGAYNEGTVFSITASGKEKVLHSFVGGLADGSYPAANLINVKGALYGTTTEGGTQNVGTVFSIAPSGKETLLYSFLGGTDGEDPEAALTYVDGSLYGTTYRGGSGDGTIFAVTTSGTETVLHRFGGSGDGAGPTAALTNVNGTLYGTTSLGGANHWGTVFSLTP